MGFVGDTKEVVTSIYDEVTDENYKAQDDEAMDFIIKAGEGGDDVDFYLKQTKNPEKTRGLLGRRMKERYPDASMDDIHGFIKTPKMSRDLAEENPVERLWSGFSADYRQVAYGLGKYVVGREDDSEVQLERKQHIKEYNAAGSFRNGWHANYDSDGERDEDQDVAGTIGSMGLDLVTGYGAGSAVKTLTKAAVLGGGVGAGLDTARYGEHQNVGELAMGITLGSAGELVGAIIAGPGRQATPRAAKSQELLNEQLAFLTDMQDKLGNDFTIDMLKNPKLLTERIKETVKNPMEREGLLHAMDKLEVGVIERIDEAARQLGTDSKTLAKYKAGQLTDEQMGVEFNNFMNEKKAWYKADEEHLYSAAKTTDIDPETGVYRP